ncbi:hypothetical protein [uncultured Ruegeria sp.]|uniref:hypothetical protein n=1 Tax=uncultured Ruegeria sp. TaxID=259304 RepID=UPI0026377DC8|nr:hypothetical protein [uncultured Ruegeria sp.]
MTTADKASITNSYDTNGDRLADLTITRSIVINADGSRSETIEYFNLDGILHRSATELISADDQAKTIDRNADRSVSAQSTSVPGETGFMVDTYVDRDTDLSISDVTVKKADGTSTRIITETA